MELTYCVQNYAWGKIGCDSLVARLKKSAEPNHNIDTNMPYAELWLGIHPNGPSHVKSLGISLEKAIKENLKEDLISGKETFERKLPFLLKVLSVRMPLSIQVHPSKSQAELLHKKSPEIYKDSNHKPEMAIALSNFEALVGFRVVDEISNFLSILPELQTVVGYDCIERLCKNQGIEDLRTCFRQLMAASKTVVKEQLDILINRIQFSDNSLRDKLMFDQLLNMHSYFPGDVGCFCLYFLNYIVLNPGESFFIPHGEPHAYIYGDCVECMANSDNVIRAGLTPKLIDVDMLLQTLTYICRTKEQIYLKKEIVDRHAVLYRPPVNEFAVLRISLQSHECYHLPPRKTFSTLICISGSGTFDKMSFVKGQAFFLWANESKEIYSAEDTLIFQAFENIN